jgi:phosphatidylserine/phosphatidylglycerophosphate/cardiolipin synthase-like enzyme
MATIKRAVAFSNNEVAFLAWELDVWTLDGCLGFHIVRETLDEHGQVTEARPLASYVAFEGQRNPDWLAQNTTVWPVQKFTWRDLTLRRRRDRASLRPENQIVRYCIRAVGKMQPGLEAVQVIPESHIDRETHKKIAHTYEGEPIPLGYLTPEVRTNVIHVTRSIGPFVSTFTNGILSTQFLLNVLMEDKKVKDGELLKHLVTPKDWLREYLAGDVLPTIHEFLDAPGSFLAALYELEDKELLDLLLAKAAHIKLILSDAGSSEEDDATVYDSRNKKARAALRAVAKKPNAKFQMQDRLFNGTGHIGHNKFVVRLAPNGKPEAVLTGSTNWTFSGVAGQSNNLIVIRDADVAAQFAEYWQRLHADVQPTPKPLSAKNTGAGQKDALKQANRKGHTSALGNAAVETWFSPNVPGKNQPPSKTAKTPSPPPPDMANLFSLMRKAKQAIFFLVFLPSRGGLTSIVSEAVALGEKDSSLLVMGAISDTQAMWGYEAADKQSGKESFSPRVYQNGGISVVRASALTDNKLVQELGDFKLAEVLTVGKAIIHDKILVLDPMDPVNCVVAFGSHNMGYKASYSNDENLVVVRGHKALALAYTAHVLDVYDHYRFRASELAKRAKEKGAPKGKPFSGFLATAPDWQNKASHRLARYLTQDFDVTVSVNARGIVSPPQVPAPDSAIAQPRPTG